MIELKSPSHRRFSECELVLEAAAKEG